MSFCQDCWIKPWRRLLYGWMDNEIPLVLSSVIWAMFDRQSDRTSGAFRGFCGKLFALAVIAGCSAETAPVTLESSEREAIKRNVVLLGARVTSDTEDGLYLALRNTYVNIRDAGGMVEGVYKTRQDIDDFAKVNAAIAKVFLE